ncbi:MAG: hypothetical protein CFE21_12170 [Bacteroidetes bacterium B1(2017)]|nr:MAG: hypothetical protein CFE21_12170 [Bacteroidetes bacterium B1(2017)]
MLHKLKRILETLKKIPAQNRLVLKQTESANMLHGQVLSALNKQNTEAILKNIQLAEFSVFSQWGDDGIIDFLTAYLDFEHQTFLEFGVEDYSEANTRYLLKSKNWTGFVMDGSRQHIQKIQDGELYWQHELFAKEAFITAENINTLITEAGFANKLGLLHIDIDGNDYHIWKAITCINPTLVIMEYNSIFGSNQAWTIPYEPEFVRQNKHFSHLYCGCSLLSYCDLAEEKGYAFVGSNRAGNNAYFVRKDKLKQLPVLSAEQGYVESKFRESRNQDGQLTFAAGSERLKLLNGLDIYNTRTKTIEKID